MSIGERTAVERSELEHRIEHWRIRGRAVITIEHITVNPDNGNSVRLAYSITNTNSGREVAQHDTGIIERAEVARTVVVEPGSYKIEAVGSHQRATVAGYGLKISVARA